MILIAVMFLICLFVGAHRVVTGYLRSDYGYKRNLHMLSGHTWLIVLFFSYDSYLHSL